MLGLELDMELESDFANPALHKLGELSLSIFSGSDRFSRFYGYGGS